jgi:hypothetical protein
MFYTISPKFYSLLIEKEKSDAEKTWQSIIMEYLGVRFKSLKNMHNFGYSQLIAKK